jgi:hypothetical protein
LACDGTKYVVLTEGNRIYTTVNGTDWAYQGVFSPTPAFSIPPSYTSGAAALVTTSHVLQWLASLSKWCLIGPNVNSFYLTSDVNAVTGWTMYTTPASVAPTPPATFKTDYLHKLTPFCELSGALFSVGQEDIMTGTTGVSLSTVRKSVDGGTTWTTVLRGIPYSMTAAGAREYFYNINVFKGYLVVYTVGGQTYRYKSTDLGATWVKEVTNLGIIDRDYYIVLPDSVTLFYPVDYNVTVFKYSTDGLTFFDSEVIVPTLNAPNPVPGSTPGSTPSGSSDPLLASVQAMNWNQYPAGALTYPLTVKDTAGSFLTWDGYPANTVSTLELPFLGGAVVKANVLTYSSWKETNSEFVRMPQTPPGSSNINPIPGDFTFEQFFATELQFDALWVTVESVTPMTGPLMKIRLGRNMGSVVAEVSIATSIGGGGAPVYSTIQVFDLPAPLTYFHFCLERVGSVVSVYLNGVLKGQVTQSVVYSISGQLKLQARYCAQYRLTVGTARYQGAFSVPTGLFPTS